MDRFDRAVAIARQMITSPDWSEFDDQGIVAILSEAGIPHVRAVIRGTASEAAEAACYAALHDIAA